MHVFGGRAVSFLWLAAALVSARLAAQQPLTASDADDRLRSHRLLGVRYLNEGQADKAVEEFRASIELAPGRGLFQALLGAALDAAGQREEALVAYRRALELEPDEAAHHNNLGTLLARDGQLEEALAHFERAARLDPDRSGTYHFNRGAVLLNAGRPADAVGPLRQAVRSDPTLAVGHFFLGVALLRTSPRRPADGGGERFEPRGGTIQSFQRYLQLQPDGPYAVGAREYLKQLGATPLPVPARPTLPGRRA